MSEIPVLLQEVADRYRRALLLKTSLLIVLVLSVLGVIAWRLSTRGLSLLWSVGVSGIVAVSAVGALVWWTHRRWMSPRGTAAYLDQTFDLQQRLITAEEYSRMASPPALYSLLAKEVVERCSTKHPRFPKPLDHTAGLLLVALLLLLFWPWQGMIRQQFAEHLGRGPGAMGHVSVPRPTSHVPTAEHPPSSSEASSSTSGQSTSGPQPSSASSAQDQRGTPSGASQSASGNQSSDRGSQSPRSRGGNVSSSTSDGQAGGSQPSLQAQTSERSSPDGQASRSATEGQQATDGRPSNDRQGQQSQGQAAASAQRAGSQANASAQEQGAAPSQRPGAGSGNVSPASQEAMKGEIQRLLKEVSGELQQLQVQLASAQQRQPQPEAGTSSDPELFESPMPEDGSAGTKPVPFVVPTDTVATKTPRPSAGVGRPEGDVSRAGPRMGREDVSLSDQPAEETAPSARQPIPPEYRGVFDRLHHEGPPREQSP